MPSDEAHHYNLFERRKGWIAESILVISPYVESQFFERVVSEARPESLIIIVDDGCRPDDVQMLENLTGKKMKVVVALGSAAGLVDSKIFHLSGAPLVAIAHTP